MANSCVTVFEIGSSKISCIVAQRGVNGIFDIKAKASASYAGFLEGEFLELPQLEDVVKSVFFDITDTYKKKIDKVFVGVPAEFSRVELCSDQNVFRFRHSVRQGDIDAIREGISSKVEAENMEILSISPISYLLDDNRKTHQPLGLKASKISAEMSVILAQSSFIQTFNRICSKIGVEQVEYISEPLSEALFITEREERERTCIVIDVGARTTSVSFVKGDGLTSLTSFSMGGSHVTSDLSEACSLSYDDASALKKQIVLSLRGESGDFYELVTLGGRVTRVPMNYAAEAVCYRIDLIAKTVNECIRLFAKEYVPYYPIFLCGAGLCKIKGGKDYFAKCIGRNVSYGVPPIPALDKPENAALLGLLNAALGDN